MSDRGLRMLVLGAGVIGSVYAARLSQSGHVVTVLARGTRLASIRGGIQLVDASTGHHSRTMVRAVAEIPETDFDLVIVAVRADQVRGALDTLGEAAAGPDVLFLGNLANERADITATLGARAFFGFPGVGGSRVGGDHTDGVVRYTLIRQQNSVLGEATGGSSARVRRVRDAFTRAGFPTDVCENIDDWLAAHAAFIVPIALALEKCDGDPAILARRRPILRELVKATRQFYAALRSSGNTEIPGNLYTLYNRLPTVFAVRYWARVMSDGRGELWFGAHFRSAPEETDMMQHQLAKVLAEGHT
jgi:2-dehydropantoate 2-reductase